MNDKGENKSSLMMYCQVVKVENSVGGLGVGLEVGEDEDFVRVWIRGKKKVN